MNHSGGPKAASNQGSATNGSARVSPKPSGSKGRSLMIAANDMVPEAPVTAGGSMNGAGPTAASATAGSTGGGGGGNRRTSAISKKSRKGECATCGMRTHKIGLFGKKTELTIEGYVYRGQCLQCNPIEGYQGGSSARGSTNRNSRRSSMGRKTHASNETPTMRSSQQQQLANQMPPHPNRMQQQQQSSSGMPTTLHQSRPHTMQNQMPPMNLQQGMSPHPAYPQVYSQVPPMHSNRQQQQGQMLTSPSSNMVIPRTLDLGCDDDDGLSVVSGITMDMRLIQGARNWNGTTAYEEVDDDPRGRAHHHGMHAKPAHNPMLHVDSDEEDAGAPPLTGGRRPGADDMYEGSRPDYGVLPGATRPVARHTPDGAAGVAASGAAYYDRRAMGGGGGIAGGGRGGNEYFEPQMPQIKEGGGRGYGSGRGGGGGPFGPVAGLDADGYPVADSGYGWNKHNDLLPPGTTMDSLLQSNATKSSKRHPPGQRGGGSASRPPRNASAEIVFDGSGEILFDPKGASAGGAQYGAMQRQSVAGGVRSSARPRSPKLPPSSPVNARPPLFMATPSQLIGRMSAINPVMIQNSDPFGANDDEEQEEAQEIPLHHLAMGGHGEGGAGGGAGMLPTNPMPSSSGTYGMQAAGMSSPQHRTSQRPGSYQLGPNSGHSGELGMATRLTHSKSSTYGAGGKDPALIVPPRLAMSQSNGYTASHTDGSPPRDQWTNTLPHSSVIGNHPPPMQDNGHGIPPQAGRRPLIPHQHSGPIVDDGHHHHHHQHHDGMYQQEMSAGEAAAYQQAALSHAQFQDNGEDGIHSQHGHDVVGSTNGQSKSTNSGGGKPKAYDREQLSQMQMQVHMKHPPQDYGKKASHVSMYSTSTAPPLRHPNLRGLPDETILVDPSMVHGDGDVADAPFHSAQLREPHASLPATAVMSAVAAASASAVMAEPETANAASAIPISMLPDMNDESVKEMARRLAEVPSDGDKQQALSINIKGGGGDGDDDDDDDDDVDAQDQNTADDIPAILQCANLPDAEPYLRERAFAKVAQIIWRLGDDAKRKIAEYQGIETLVNAMWSDIGNANIQAAAANMLLAVVSSTNSVSSGDFLSTQASESACDALLFSMRTHEGNVGIQLAGCCVLSCLAATSGANRSVTDGTLAGAVSMVADAMFTHQQSIVIQKAGVHALYNQCVLSNNAEGNKRRLLETKVDNGSHSSLDVMVNTMRTLQGELASLELVCKLCWSLGSNEELCKTLSTSSTILNQIVDTAQSYHINPEAGALYESIFGLLGNMAHLEQNRSAIQEVGAIQFILDGMRFHRNDATVNLEACAALGNLSNSRLIRDAIVKAGGVGAVIRAMQAFIRDAQVVEEAIRALVCIAIDADDATKEILAMPQVIQSISRASEEHGETGAIQEMCSSLIASLILSPECERSIVENGAIDVVLRSLGSSPDEKVQAAACIAFRNLACRMEDSDVLLQNKSIRLLIKAMEANEGSVAVQLNACSTLWYLAHKTRQQPGEIVDQQGVRCIVKAMQGHMESGELLETACGALWSLVDESMDRKKDVVASGAIDAVTCALVMHPDRTGTLEKACGVLSNVSEGPLAEAIANAQGVSIVVEAMRSNFQCAPLLETGCVVLRNILVQFPDFSSEAEGAISTIINAMRDHPKEVDFQREACNALWVMAAQSENCQAKILALDGVTVLMKSLGHNNEIPKVQKAAWGAFNQLAVDPMNFT